MPGRDSGTDDQTPDYSSIAGGDPSTQQTGEPSPDDARMTVVRTIRQLTSQIDSIAQQFPEFSEAARGASQMLMKGAAAITGGQRGPGKAGTPPAQ